MPSDEDSVAAPPYVEAALEEIYVEQDCNQHETWSRLNQFVPQNYTQDEVRKLLVDLDLFEPEDSTRRFLEDADPGDVGDPIPEIDDPWKGLNQRRKANE